MNLSKDKIKRLRAESHRLGLKPVVTIGQKGLSDSVQAEIDAALAHHELVKLRIPALPRADKRAFADALCRGHGAQLIEAIGNVIVLYRPNPEKRRFASLLEG